MVQSAIQTAFHTGELAPSLYARVDLQKYHAAAALLRNFYVDYRGGASTRPGTLYVNRAFKSASPVRLIPFQPSSNTSYVLEFGDAYIRFHSNSAPILEASFAVTSITGNSITAAGNNFAAGDWVFIGGAYYIVLVGGSPFTVSDLWGNASVTPTGTTAARVYTLPSPFRATDLFPNPITGNAGIKFVQSVQSLIICHQSYATQILTINSAANWTISAINFASTIGTPTGLAVVSTDTPGTTWYYGYLVTAVDINNQESATPAPVTFAGTNYIGDSANHIANTISWNSVAGAQSYNVYATSPSFKAAPPAGAQYGFIANVTGTSFIESFPGITRDFAQTPPIVQNPFSGTSVQSYTVTANGIYTTVPTVSVTGGGGTGATAQASLGVTVATINNHASPANEDVTSPTDPTGALLTFPNGVVLKITSASLVIGAQWTVNSVSIFNPGSITSGTTPSNPMPATGFTPPITGYSIGGPPNLNFNFTWGVTQVNGVNGGEGFTSVPSVAFSSGAAAATAVLSTTTGSNPAVPGFLQERLALAGLQNSPMTFDLSQPASFFNFNTSNPVQPDDAITGTIFSGELNDIKSLTPVPTGLLVLSGRLAWIVNGGGGLSAYNPITPSNAVANPQTFTGANDLPPLKINQDLLYVTHKGSYVRDLNYNIYANVFSGQDISVLSSHLFFNHYLVQWAWGEEPFKVAWAIREDGVMLSLTYVKDQELIGWCHHDTNGQFMSVCSVLETSSTGNTVDAIYVVVQRFINGQTVQYVERLTDRYFTYGKEDSWSVDAGLQTTPNVSFTSGTLTVTGNASVVSNSVTLTDTGNAPFTATMATNNWLVRANGGIYKITAFTSASQVTATVSRVSSFIDQYTGTPFPVVKGYGIWQPVTSVTNLSHLIGQAVTGVADGTVITGTVSGTGTLAVSPAASKITIGLAFTPQLQTLPLDLGNPTIQGKPKQINAVSVRVADTLGLSIGSSFSTIVPMKESTLGNQNYYLNSTVSDLINADTRTQIDSTWTIPGQYCIQQTLPYPASILGVVPEFANTQRQG